MLTLCEACWWNLSRAGAESAWVRVNLFDRWEPPWKSNELEQMMHQSPVAPRDTVGGRRTGRGAADWEGVIEGHPLVSRKEYRGDIFFKVKSCRRLPGRDLHGLFIPGVQLREGERESVDPLEGSRLYLRGPPLASHSAALSICLVTGPWVRVWCLAARVAVIGIQNGGCWWWWWKLCVGVNLIKKAEHAYSSEAAWRCTAVSPSARQRPAADALLNGTPGKWNQVTEFKIIALFKIFILVKAQHTAPI